MRVGTNTNCRRYLESAEGDFVPFQPAGVREEFVCWDATTIGAATGRWSDWLRALKERTAVWVNRRDAGATLESVEADFVLLQPSVLTGGE